MTDNPKTPKRVAVLCSYAPSLLNFRGALIDRMIDGSHDVICFAPEFDADTRGVLEAKGVLCVDIDLKRTGLNPIADWRTLRQLTDLFKRYAPDVFFGYTPKASIYGTIAAYRSGVPIRVPMITGLGYAFLDGGREDRKRRRVRSVMVRLYRYALRRASTVIFHNKDDRRVLQELGGLTSVDQSVIVDGSGVDLERFQYVKIKSATPAGAVKFLMLSRLVHYKGVREFCDAAEQLVGAGYNAQFSLVGPDEGGPAGVDRTALRALAPCVQIERETDDVASHIEKSDIYVLPSYGEGLPRTVLEAMAIGRPIITTDARGCRETVDEMVNGILVPARSSEALADAMVRMIENRALLPAMGQASRRKAEQRFDVRIINDQMMRILTLD